jgi:hypothetical protein
MWKVLGEAVTPEQVFSWLTPLLALGMLWLANRYKLVLREIAKNPKHKPYIRQGNIMSLAFLGLLIVLGSVIQAIFPGWKRLDEEMSLLVAFDLLLLVGFSCAKENTLLYKTALFSFVPVFATRFVLNTADTTAVYYTAMLVYLVLAIVFAVTWHRQLKNSQSEVS